MRTVWYLGQGQALLRGEVAVQDALQVPTRRSREESAAELRPRTARCQRGKCLKPPRGPLPLREVNTLQLRGTDAVQDPLRQGTRYRRQGGAADFWPCTARCPPVGGEILLAATFLHPGPDAHIFAERSQCEEPSGRLFEIAVGKTLTKSR